MIKKKAYAKFDLGIMINPSKAEDGYYPVNYINCQIDLCDELTFELQEKGIDVICSDPGLPTDEKNFVFKAAKLLRELRGNDKLGVKIKLDKNIPIKAGFGGGSSDAAATILGLSELWKIKIDDDLVKNLSKTLGKDFFYSIYGGLCEVSGVGRNYSITRLIFKIPQFWVMVVVPFEQKPSTSWVYEHLSFGGAGNNSKKFMELKKNISENDRMRFLKSVCNDFEESVVSHYPVVDQMKSDLKKLGAEAELMAGAGLSVVGFFKNRQEAELGRKKLIGKYKTIIVSKIRN